MHRIRYCSIKPTKNPLVTTSQMNPEWLLVWKNWAWRSIEESRTWKPNCSAIRAPWIRLETDCMGLCAVKHGKWGCGWMNDVKLSSPESEGRQTQDPWPDWWWWMIEDCRLWRIEGIRKLQLICRRSWPQIDFIHIIIINTLFVSLEQLIQFPRGGKYNK